MNGDRSIGRRPRAEHEEVSAWCSSVLARALDAPAGEPGAWASGAAAGLGATARGLRAALLVESELDDLAARSVSFTDDDFLAHQWLRSLGHGESAPSRTGTLGLYGIESASAGVRTPDGGAGLTVEIAGGEPGWRAPEAVSDGLPIAASMLAKVYERLVVTPVVRRRAILRRLRPTQQVLIPHLVGGLSEAEIAGKIGRSRHTVHDHTKKIYKALGVHTRLDLAALWNGYGDANDDGASGDGVRDAG